MNAGSRFLAASTRQFKPVKQALDMADPASLVMGPVLLSSVNALLIFITTAVNQTCICTFHLPLNRVRLRPCNSFDSAKTPSALTFRSCMSWGAGHLVPSTFQAGCRGFESHLLLQLTCKPDFTYKICDKTAREGGGQRRAPGPRWHDLRVCCHSVRRGQARRLPL